MVWPFSLTVVLAQHPRFDPKFSLSYNTCIVKQKGVTKCKYYMLSLVQLWVYPL